MSERPDPIDRSNFDARPDPRIRESGANSRNGDSHSNPRIAGSPSAVADAEFALLLTHDVDRPYKSFQSLYHAVERRDLGQLKALAPGVNPWWQFDDLTSLEDSLGVRSSFYFLREPHILTRDVSDWFDPFYWIEHVGRYDVETPELLDLIDRLRDGGWEVGLHCSYDSYDDPDRLGLEKGLLEAALGEEVVGCRHHHLNRGPDTWDHHRDIGLKYDASVGSATEYGFEYGYHPVRPFDDEFVVFPLTLMENALPDPGEDFEAAWAVCEDLLAEAAANDGVMSVLWHPRLFTESDFPGYRRVYRLLVEQALDMGAWVGSPGDYYDLLDHPGDDAATDTVDATDGGLSPATESVEPGEAGVSRVEDDDKTPLRASQGGDNKVKTATNTESTG